MLTIRLSLSCLVPVPLAYDELLDADVVMRCLESSCASGLLPDWAAADDGTVVKSVR
jgi:hypothetical protein